MVSIFLSINSGSVPWYLVIAGFPIATGIAILKYRLYDIDLIINRTLVYGTLTAARVIANFSATLRGEIDLNQLQEQLIAVVEETMQPAHVSLWLRAPERPENYRDKAGTGEL